MKEAADLVRAGLCDASAFRMHVGQCGWGPGQLEGEIRMGTWLMARPVQLQAVLALADLCIASEGRRVAGIEVVDARAEPLATATKVLGAEDGSGNGAWRVLVRSLGNPEWAAAVDMGIADVAPKL
jgi:hypothetical protein